MRTLSARELNRSLLARQLLLERSSKSAIKALEAVGGLQTQNATGGYIGLWTRLQKFAMADLTKALEERRAVQGTMMRITIHLVTAEGVEHWPPQSKPEVAAALVERIAAALAPTS